MKMSISLGSSILVLGMAVSIFAEDRGVVQRQVSQGADSLNLTYLLIVNGHEFIANLVNTDMYVTVDGVEFDVLTGIDHTGRFTWEASNKSNHGLAFKGFLDSDGGLTLLTLESTGDDSLFVESKTITLIADDHLAELFGVDVGTLLTEVYTVRTWTLESTDGSPSDGNPLALQQTIFVSIVASDCGCFRGGGNCTQEDCNSGDSCGNGVCYELGGAE